MLPVFYLQAFRQACRRPVNTVTNRHERLGPGRRLARSGGMGSGGMITQTTRTHVPNIWYRRHRKPACDVSVVKWLRGPSQYSIRLNPPFPPTPTNASDSLRTEPTEKHLPMLSCSNDSAVPAATLASACRTRGLNHDGPTGSCSSWQSPSWRRFGPTL